jgi:predicted RNA-binding protein with PUA-like domain
LAFWLLKTEPEDFGWADQCARGAEGEIWTGVRNHQASQALEAMAEGDLALFYHTGQEKSVVGIVMICGPAFADPTDPAWRAVLVKPQAGLRRPVSLGALKLAQSHDPTLDGLVLLRNPRLSVQPVTETQWTAILALAGGTVAV